MVLSQIVFLGLIVAALGCFGLACKTWLSKIGSVELSVWRTVVFSLGFLAVALQIVLFALSSTHIATNYILFGRWARMVLPSYLVAAVCILAGKGAARWWLLTSSSILFIICFLIVLTA
jgi:hypothetical protein